MESGWIDFFEVTPESVRIEIAVHNHGTASSPPQDIRIDVASLGAFLPWRPLTTLRLPTIDPRRTLTVAREVARLGLTTTTTAIDRLRRAANKAGRLDHIRDLDALWQGAWETGMALVPELSLPWEPAELLGARRPHWAGNLRVRIGDQACQRQMARGLRFSPGETNMVLLALGEPGPDVRLDFGGSAAGWNARTAVEPTGHGLFPTESAPVTPLVVAFDPPPHAKQGTLEIGVQRRSDGAREVVELELARDAAGPGCFLI